MLHDMHVDNYIGKNEGKNDVGVTVVKQEFPCCNMKMYVLPTNYPSKTRMIMNIYSFAQ